MEFAKECNAKTIVKRSSTGNDHVCVACCDQCQTRSGIAIMLNWVDLSDVINDVIKGILGCCSISFYINSSIY